MLRNGVQCEEKLFRHPASDLLDQTAGQGNRLLLHGNAGREIGGDALAVKLGAFAAVADRPKNGRPTAQDVANAVVEVPADEIVDRLALQSVQGTTIGGKVAIEADALRRGAVPLKRIAGKGRPRGCVEPDEAVVVVARSLDGAEAAFQKLPVAKKRVRLHSLEERLWRGGVFREAGADANRDLHRIAQRVGGRCGRRDPDAVFCVQRVVAADMVAVDMGAEQPVDVRRREPESRESGKKKLLRLQMRGVYQEVPVPAHKRDPGPNGSKRDAQQKRPWKDFLEKR